MKTSGLTLVFGLALLNTVPVAATGWSCDAEDPSQTRLRISIDNVHSTKGSINVTIYPDDAPHFLDGKYKLFRQRVSIVLPVTQFCIAMPTPANYAVALFHDENDNGHLDKTLLGLPDEGYGFSNNPHLILGPPALDAVRFAAHAGDNPVLIHLRY